MESEYFDDINDLLPIPSNIISNIDKGGSLRLFVAYIQLKHFMFNISCTSRFKIVISCLFFHFILFYAIFIASLIMLGNAKSKKVYNDVGDQLYAEAIDGFLLILNLSGNIIFLSENVIKYLGISQVSRSFNHFLIFKVFYLFVIIIPRRLIC